MTDELAVEAERFALIVGMMRRAGIDPSWVGVYDFLADRGWDWTLETSPVGGYRATVWAPTPTHGRIAFDWVYPVPDMALGAAAASLVASFARDDDPGEG